MKCEKKLGAIRMTLLLVSVNLHIYKIGEPSHRSET